MEFQTNTFGEFKQTMIPTKKIIREDTRKST